MVVDVAAGCCCCPDAAVALVFEVSVALFVELLFAFAMKNAVVRSESRKNSNSCMKIDICFYCCVASRRSLIFDIIMSIFALFVFFHSAYLSLELSLINEKLVSR